MLRNFNKNSGFVLPIGMMFLIVLSVLAIGALKDVSLEEKMASNFSDKHVANLRAENALNALEGINLRAVSTSELQTSDGFNDSSQFPEDAPDFRNDGWINSNNTITVANVELLAPNGEPIDDPDYPVAFVEKLYTVEALGIGKGDDDSESEQNYYRFTVRATGNDPETITTLQSVVRQ